MIRLATWILFSLALALGVYWLLQLPGTATIEAAGYRLQPRLGTVALIGLVGFAFAAVTWGIVRRVLAAPHYFARARRERRREAGVGALSDGFIALQAGDPGRARVLAREARGLLPANHAAQLLEARADLALGDLQAAREHYRALISNKKTAVAALAGLYEQARAQGRSDAALAFAQKAVALAPQTRWASEAVLGDLTARGDWTAALARLSADAAYTREEKFDKRRKQAVIETALARELVEADPLAALEHALAALKLVPDFVPAAVIAARVQSNRGEVRRAMSLLRRVWRATAHPHMALLYANAQSGASAVERFKRVRELIDLPPLNRPAALVFARAAIDAFEWQLARDVLAPFIIAEPTQGVCVLMAEIEEGQVADYGKARAWLSRAVRAPADPTWTADGVISDDWAPVSPVTGRLDAFEWRVPLSAVLSGTTGRASIGVVESTVDIQNQLLPTPPQPETSLAPPARDQ